MASPNRPNDSRTNSTLPRRAPLAGRQRDRLGVQPFSAGHQHTGAAAAAACRRAPPAPPPPTTRSRSGPRPRRVRGATAPTSRGQPRRGHRQDHRVGMPVGALVVAQRSSPRRRGPTVVDRRTAPSAARSAPPARRAAPGSRRRSRRTPAPPDSAAAPPARRRSGWPRRGPAPRPRVGTAARRPIVAAEPAYTPASIGSTDRATTCSPNRSPTTSATAGSAPRRQRSGRDGSAAIRATVASSTSPAIDAAELGMPLTVSGGQRMQAGPAVDQRPHPGGADLARRPGPVRPAAPAPRGGAPRTPRRRRPSAGRRPARCAAPRRAGRPGRTR